LYCKQFDRLKATALWNSIQIQAKQALTKDTGHVNSIYAVFLGLGNLSILFAVDETASIYFGVLLFFVCNEAVYTADVVSKISVTDLTNEKLE